MNNDLDKRLAWVLLVFVIVTLVGYFAAVVWVAVHAWPLVGVYLSIAFVGWWVVRAFDREG